MKNVLFNVKNFEIKQNEAFLLDFVVVKDFLQKHWKTDIYFIKKCCLFGIILTLD